MPRIDGILSRLNETRYKSSLDLKDAFWQIELHPSSREITAFTVPGRPLYHFFRMPFGLCNAAQSMCRLIIMSQKNLTGRLARWSLKLQSVDFTIEHRRGSKNIVADTLSRAIIEELETVVGLPINLSDPEFKSPSYEKLLESIKNQEKSLPDLKINEGVIYKRT